MNLIQSTDQLEQRKFMGDRSIKVEKFGKWIEHLSANVRHLKPEAIAIYEAQLNALVLADKLKKDICNGRSVSLSLSLSLSRCIIGLDRLPTTK
jgi:hypothetical protein